MPTGDRRRGPDWLFAGFWWKLADNRRLGRYDGGRSTTDFSNEEQHEKRTMRRRRLAGFVVGIRPGPRRPRAPVLGAAPHYRTRGPLGVTRRSRGESRQGRAER